MSLLTAAEVAERPAGAFKFVRVAGTYRFHDVLDDYSLQHRDMVAAGERAESAGSILLNRYGWKLWSSFSDSLGVAADPPTHADLTRILGRPEESADG